jgi:23S rRNA pseudouridine2605 synthase
MTKDSNKNIRDGKPEIPKTDGPRLQKFIAEAGLCSRRKAEEWIAEGQVTVNGKVAQLGMRVNPSDDNVRVNGRQVRPRISEKVSLIMHKPRGFACTNDDPYAERIVFDLLPKQYAKHRLFCAGRLDKDSEGLLVITDDGALAHRLTHPSSEVKKVYTLKLSRPLEPAHIPLLEKGRKVEGEFLRIDKVLHSKSNKKFPKRIEVEMGHGKKREIRRLFATFSYTVERLQRVNIGRFSIRNLSLGQVRELTHAEIDLLFA